VLPIRCLTVLYYAATQKEKVKVTVRSFGIRAVAALRRPVVCEIAGALDLAPAAVGTLLARAERAFAATYEREESE